MKRRRRESSKMTDKFGSAVPAADGAMPDMDALFEIAVN